MVAQLRHQKIQGGSTFRVGFVLETMHSLGQTHSSMTAGRDAAACAGLAGWAVWRKREAG